MPYTSSGKGSAARFCRNSGLSNLLYTLPGEISLPCSPEIRNNHLPRWVYILVVPRRIGSHPSGVQYPDVSRYKSKYQSRINAWPVGHINLESTERKFEVVFGVRQEREGGIGSRFCIFATLTCCRPYSNSAVAVAATTRPCFPCILALIIEKWDERSCTEPLSCL